MSTYFEIVQNNTNLDINGLWTFTTFYIDATNNNIDIIMSTNNTGTYYEFIRLDNSNNIVNILNSNNDPYLELTAKKTQYIIYLPNDTITYQIPLV